MKADTRRFDNVHAIEWCHDELKLLDQRVLPTEISYLCLKTASETARAIKDMIVRGAPAIGISAGYGVVLSVKEHFETGASDWLSRVYSDMEVLRQSRPTAVNLFWALDRMQQCLEMSQTKPDVVGIIEKEAIQIHTEDIESNYRMGDIGAEYIAPGSEVITHCNAGALATGGYGTALGVIRSGYAQGKIDRVYADETRPWLQGSRLTAWELMKDEIPVCLQADVAAAHLMRQKKIAWIIVGADRIAANGDVANKIGTYQLAISAKYHDVKVMVVAPTSTFDLSLKSGDEIPIEYRGEEEVVGYRSEKTAPQGVEVNNPVFDVTPAALIDVLVTEKGAVENPNEASVRTLVNR